MRAFSDRLLAWIVHEPAERETGRGLSARPGE